MADFDVPDVDDDVIEALKARAKRRGVSLEDEICDILREAVSGNKGSAPSQFGRLTNSDN